MERTTERTTETREQVILRLAEKYFGVEGTLESRGLDRLDFYEVAVWNMHAALESAYEAGRKASARG